MAANSLNTGARSDIARLLMDQARVVLVYLGIIATSPLPL
jgi:hypothetical protein